METKVKESIPMSLPVKDVWVNFENKGTIGDSWRVPSGVAVLAYSFGILFWQLISFMSSLECF